MPLTNQEKTKNRNESMNEIAKALAVVCEDFSKFSDGDPTWRRFETFIKRKWENGEKIAIVVKPPQINFYR